MFADMLFHILVVKLKLLMREKVHAVINNKKMKGGVSVYDNRIKRCGICKNP